MLIPAAGKSIAKKHRQSCMNGHLSHREKSRTGVLENQLLQLILGDLTQIPRKYISAIPGNVFVMNWLRYHHD